MAELPPLEWEGFEAPHYTQVPDAFFDVLMSYLSEGELRVLLYIIRRTFGFKKTADDISLGQITDGITTKDGRRLDYGAGVSKSTAIRAVRGLAERGIILAKRNQSVERGHEATTYVLRMKATPLSHSDTSLVSQRYQASAPIEQALVSPLDTQETAVQEDREQEGNGSLEQAPYDPIAAAENEERLRKLRARYGA